MATMTKDIISYLQNLIFLYFIDLLYTRTRTVVKKYGDDYGGWFIPTNILDENAICYSAGVGENISFDKELIKEYKCKVVAFDPTPRSIEYIKQFVSDKLQFYPYGIWNKDEEKKFYQPADPTHVSHSILNLQETDSFFVAECKSLNSIMDELGHNHLDLLKLDIEGAEHKVIKDIIENKISIAVICVEFDQPYSKRGVMNTISYLIECGYQLIWRDHWNFTFVSKNLSTNN